MRKLHEQYQHSKHSPKLEFHNVRFNFLQIVPGSIVGSKGYQLQVLQGLERDKTGYGNWSGNSLWMELSEDGTLKNNTGIWMLQYPFQLLKIYSSKRECWKDSRFRNLPPI